MTRWLAIFIFEIALHGLVHGEEWECQDQNVGVQAIDRAQGFAACEVAASVLGFLSAHGLDVTGRIELNLVDQLQAPCALHSFGCYSHPDQRAFALTTAGCLKKETWQNLPLDPALCNGFLAHEAAHAVAAANFRIDKPSTVAQEYLAGVATVATMPHGPREHLLEQLPGRGFDSADQISTTYYLFAPARFSAEVYRHFLGLRDRQEFIEKVLRGRVLTEER